MNYQLVQQLISLAESFEKENKAGLYGPNVEGFKTWLAESHHKRRKSDDDPDWERKSTGRTAESVIATLLVHMNRYAKNYSRSAIHNSEFSTQDEFSYLINLQAFGPMSKMHLIKKNVHDKPAGIQIINRLSEKGWINQTASKEDKRTTLISISEKGRRALRHQMPKIKMATQIVSANLTDAEKRQLIAILSKMDAYHQTIFQQNLANEDLIHSVATSRSKGKTQ